MQERPLNHIATIKVCKHLHYQGLQHLHLVLNRLSSNAQGWLLCYLLCGCHWAAAVNHSTTAAPAFLVQVKGRVDSLSLGVLSFTSPGPFARDLPRCSNDIMALTGISGRAASFLPYFFPSHPHAPISLRSQSGQRKHVNDIKQTFSRCQSLTIANPF
jgi:hypothetical protein